MAQQIILRRGLSTEWSAVGGSLVLGAGEPGFETDTGKLKIGDGSSVWNAIDYVTPSTLSDLTDVSIAEPAMDQVLTWTGMEWAPETLPASTTYSIGSETKFGGFGADIVLEADGQPSDIITITGSGTVTVSSSDVNNIVIDGGAFSTVNNTFTGTTNVNTLNATSKVITSDIETSGTLLVTTPQVLSIRATDGTNFGSASAGVDGVITQVFNNPVFAATTITQAHELPDSAFYQWTRSRGTISAPTIIQDGDALGSIRFSGYNGTVNAFGAAITVRISGTPSVGIPIPTKMAFSTNNGTTGGAIRAELSPTGIWQVNQIKSLTTNGNLEFLNNGTGIVQLPAGTTVGGVPVGTIQIQGSVANAAALPGSSTLGFLYITQDNGHGHIYDGAIWIDLGVIQGPAGANGTNGANGFNGNDGVGVPVGGTTGQVLLKSSNADYATEWGTASTVAAIDDLTDVVITGTPTTGQVLKYDGANWVNGEDSTVGVFTRTTASGTTSSLADGATGPINITGFKSYALLKIQTSAAAWVRIYTSEAARIADASRLEGTDPAPGAGIIAEVITTGAETVSISPGVVGFNDETVVTTNIPCRVTNKSGSSAAITVTTTLIKLEA